MPRDEVEEEVQAEAEKLIGALYMRVIILEAQNRSLQRLLEGLTVGQTDN